MRYPVPRQLFFFNDTATTEIYTLSLHDALPICNPQLSFATRMEDWTCLGQHKRQPEFPVVTRESGRNSRKTTWLPRHRKMKRCPATAPQGKSHVGNWIRKGAWDRDDLLSIVDQVDAIEVFNSRCIHSEDNAKALEFANVHGKLMTCGSDAHLASEYGLSVVRVRPFANNADGLRAALKDAARHEQLSSVWVHFGSTYAKWVKRFFPSLR